MKGQLPYQDNMTGIQCPYTDNVVISVYLGLSSTACFMPKLNFIYKHL